MAAARRAGTFALNPGLGGRKRRLDPDTFQLLDVWEGFDTPWTLAADDRSVEAFSLADPAAVGIQDQQVAAGIVSDVDRAAGEEKAERLPFSLTSVSQRRQRSSTWQIIEDQCKGDRS
jgi:hypothetical protein